VDVAVAVAVAVRIGVGVAVGVRGLKRDATLNGADAHKELRLLFCWRRGVEDVVVYLDICYPSARLAHRA
jgi:hypothetical protein